MPCKRKVAVGCRSASPLKAGETFTLQWSSTDATSVTRVCTSTGTGYTDSSTLAISGSDTGTANAAWVGFPSKCTWTATGPGGSKTLDETVLTVLAPTITVTRTPNPMVAGQNFTLAWRTTNTTTLTRACTTTTAGGFVSNGSMSIDASGDGSTPTAPADANWVNKPSTCTWSATGPGGTATFLETMTTNAAPTGPQITYIHTDGLGSPVARTDEKGVIISRTRYEPYGATAGGATPTIGFTGHVNDADTGLTYMQQRYYDPVAGRFMSVDPVLTDANSGASFNRYVYANNSPYNKIDRDGRIAETPWDAFNVALGVTSMTANLAMGNYGKAAVDAVGVVVDSLATATPVVPGGAATAINAVRVANTVGHAAPAAAKVEKAAAAGEKVVYRRGANDTKKLLETQAASAEKVIGIHGVSVSTSAAAKEGQVVRSATCCALEKAGFKVTQTGKDLNHHTVELPKPVTSETAKTWNELFK